MDTQIRDKLFEEIKTTGESLKDGLWTDDDLGTLRSIAADVAELEAKAQAAMLGLPSEVPDDIGDIARVGSPDPARAAMYRKAADRALDSAANLAIVRMQAVASQLEAVRNSFTARLWKAITDLVPGLSSAPPG
jgi:hypothetical protein